MSKKLECTKIEIVFDGPPSHEAGRFVEVEQDGKSINFGEWREREDGYWVLEFDDTRTVLEDFKESLRVKGTCSEAHLQSRLTAAGKILDEVLEIGPQCSRGFIGELHNKIRAFKDE